MALTYPGGPSVSLAATGLSQAIQGPAPTKVVGIIGDSPKGADHCGVMSLSDAVGFFGNPSAASSALSKIPRALSLLANIAQIQGAQPFNVAIMAAGKQSATVTFGTGGVLTATGLYAGSRSTNLTLTVNCASSLITSIVINDTTLPSGSQIVQQFLAAPNGPYNLSTPLGVMNAINGANPISNPNCVVRMTTIPTALPTTTVTGTAFSGTTSDGVGVAATDASIDTLLAESLAFDLDYVCPLFDVAAVQPKVATHLSACASELVYRKFMMAPQATATFAAITSTGSPYLPALSDRYNVWGVPPINIIDPVSGAPAAVDPYYFAVIMAGLKAAFPVQMTLDELQVPGVLGFAGWSDHGPYLSLADLKSIGAAGFASARIDRNRPGVFVNDNITAGAYSLDGQTINPFYQLSIRDQDDLVSKTAVAVAKQFRGQPAPGTTTMAAEIQNATDEALASLGILASHQTTVTPLSGNPFNYNEVITYVPQWPVLGIAITTGFSFS